MKIDLPHPSEIDSVGTQIVIHPWDTWNVDITLAYVVVPLLKQLKVTKHGYPSEFSNEAEWDDVMDEMIFAFESKLTDWEDQYYGPWVKDPEKNTGGEFEWIDHAGLKAHQERITNGFKLFGKYYENLWD